MKECLNLMPDLMPYMVSNFCIVFGLLKVHSHDATAIIRKIRIVCNAISTFRWKPENV